MSKAISLIFVAASAAFLFGQTNGTQSGISGGGSTAAEARWSASVFSPGSIMLSGIVRMDDGSSVPANVNIEVVCNGMERTVTHTTLSDDFGFQWNDGILRTGSPSPSDSMLKSMASSNSDAAAVVRGNETTNDCDLRAELGGYSSSAVNLNNPASFDGRDVGVIWLHRTGQEGGGNLVSVFALSAPKDAKKSFDKGTDLMRAHKWSEAARDFQKAVAIYPNYADAWLSLGRVQFTTGSNDAARNSFEHAVHLDAKLTGGWQSLGYLASNDHRWSDAAQYLDKAVTLEPLSSPLAWFISAQANYNLGQLEHAERSIRAEMRLDTQMHYPRAKYLFALILIGRNDVRGGAEALRSYLASSPDPRDVESAKTVLSRLQIASAK